MGRLRELILIRHGETEGESSIRYYGSTDVDLSPQGREQMRRASGELSGREVDLVGASPMKRSWKGAAIVSRGAQVRLFQAFREVDFGRWEGFTDQEIQDTDPTRHSEWKNSGEDFTYPSGESRTAFKQRVSRELAGLLEEEASSALLVLHKGVIRILVDILTGQSLDEGKPELGQALFLNREDETVWSLGSKSSNPDGLAKLAES